MSVLRLRIEARDAHLQGDHARALELATRALSLEPSGSLHGIIVRELLDLAGEPHDPALLMRALGHAEACAHEAPQEPPSPNRDALLALCREQLSLHAARFARVVVEVPASAVGAQVTVAGRPLAAREPGIAYTNPGRVLIAVAAPGHLPFRREVEVASGASVHVAVALTRPTVRAPRAEVEAPRRPIGLVIAGASVGAAALAVSGAAWWVADGMCADDPASRDGCYVATEGEAQTVRTLDTVTNVALVTAGLAAVGTALYVMLRPTGGRSQTRVAVSAGLGSLGLVGTF